MVMAGPKSSTLPSKPTVFELTENKLESSETKLEQRYSQELCKRERAIIKSARKEGLLKVLSVSELIKRSSELQGKGLKSVEDVKIVNFSFRRLTAIGPLSCCSSLVVCNLANNFLKGIDGLKICKNLKKLDVHSNQIATLPGEEFWEELPNLSILYLHDNGIADVKFIREMACCPSLLILTMYDTPVSLKRFYRHCVVNAIWSLKVLDHLVISDEEIMEDARFPSRYTTAEPKFKINFKSLHNRTDRSLKKELLSISEDIAEVNRTQAKLCPVVMIQKVVRGHLARKQYRKLLEERNWAAIVIQRFYRLLKGFSIHPHNSFAVRNQQPDDDVRSVSSPRLDYDSYIAMRESKDRSVISPAAAAAVDARYSKLRDGHVHATPSDLRAQIEELDTKVTKIIQKTCHPKFVPALPVNVDFAKAIKEREQKAIEAKSGIKGSELYNMTVLRHGQSAMRDKERVGVYFTPHYFLGETKQTEPISTTNTVQAPTSILEGLDDDLKTNFRLRAVTPPILKRELLEELILRTAQGAEDVRNSKKVIGDYLASLPTPIAPIPARVTLDQRHFIRAYGTMNLSNLMAVEHAYRKRNEKERSEGKRKTARAIRSRNKTGNESVRHFKEQRSNHIALKNRKEQFLLQTKMAEMAEEEAAKAEGRVNKIKKEEQMRKMTKKVGDFVTDYKTQLSSIRNAIVNHEHTEKRNALIQQRHEFAESMRDRSDLQKESMARYFEQRQQVRKAEAALEKANVDALLASQRAKSATEAKRRVKRSKAKDRQRSPVASKPSFATAHSEHPILGVISNSKIQTLKDYFPGLFKEHAK